MRKTPLAPALAFAFVLTAFLPGSNPLAACNPMYEPFVSIEPNGRVSFSSPKGDSTFIADPFGGAPKRLPLHDGGLLGVAKDGSFVDLHEGDRVEWHAADGSPVSTQVIPLVVKGDWNYRAAWGTRVSFLEDRAGALVLRETSGGEPTDVFIVMDGERRSTLGVGNRANVVVGPGGPLVVLEGAAGFLAVFPRGERSVVVGPMARRWFHRAPDGRLGAFVYEDGKRQLEIYGDDGEVLDSHPVPEREGASLLLQPTENGYLWLAGPRAHALEKDLKVTREAAFWPEPGVDPSAVAERDRLLTKCRLGCTTEEWVDLATAHDGFGIARHDCEIPTDLPAALARLRGKPESLGATLTATLLGDQLFLTGGLADAIPALSDGPAWLREAMSPLLLVSLGKSAPEWAEGGARAALAKMPDLLEGLDPRFPNVPELRAAEVSDVLIDIERKRLDAKDTPRFGYPRLLVPVIAPPGRLLAGIEGASDPWLEAVVRHLMPEPECCPGGAPDKDAVRGFLASPARTEVGDAALVVSLLRTAWGFSSETGSYPVALKRGLPANFLFDLLRSGERFSEKDALRILGLARKADLPQPDGVPRVVEEAPTSDQ